MSERRDWQDQREVGMPEERLDLDEVRSPARHWASTTASSLYRCVRHLTSRLSPAAAALRSDSCELTRRANRRRQSAITGWLPGQLEPITSADPGELTKYVVALLKKDKPKEDLRKNCVQELEVSAPRATATPPCRCCFSLPFSNRFF